MFDTQFVNRINALLAEKGIEKRTFYSDCGITSSAFSQWATGKTTPREKKLREIAEYLGVTFEYLINEKEETPTAFTDDGLTDCLEILRERPDTRALVHAGRDMTPEQVEKVAAFMRSIRG